MNPGKANEITIRNEIQPGDLGRIVELHGILYAREYGFDYQFEAYVARTLGEFASNPGGPPGKLWVAETRDSLAGSVGAVLREDGQTQLRWLLVHPVARGQGLGRTLVSNVVDFAAAAGCRSVYLWTVSPLVDAARLYQSCGFELTGESETRSMWGTAVVEQRYDRVLSEDRPACGRNAGANRRRKEGR